MSCSLFFKIKNGDEKHGL